MMCKHLQPDAWLSLSAMRYVPVITIAIEDAFMLNMMLSAIPLLRTPLAGQEHVSPHAFHCHPLRPCSDAELTTDATKTWVNSGSGALLSRSRSSNELPQRNANSTSGKGTLSTSRKQRGRVSKVKQNLVNVTVVLPTSAQAELLQRTIKPAVRQ